MTPHQLLGGLSLLALLVATAALVLVVLVGRQSGRTTTTLRRHRLAHARVEGTADPDRRQRDEGPPPEQPERRHPPEPEPVDGDPTAFLPVVGRHATRPRPRPPAPTRQDRP